MKKEKLNLFLITLTFIFLQIILASSQTEPNCSSDLQCGVNGFIGNNFCSSDNLSIFGNYNTFLCNNNGTNESFCSNSTSPLIVLPCLSTQLCENAVCKNVTCFNNINCSDANNYTFDLCNNPGTLNSTCSYLNITCLNDGDSKCNDNNNYTEDHCLSPGQTNSTCTHATIACISERDPVCADNNTYTEDICSNPNTISSSCTHLNITCLSDADPKCNDNNISTKDYCILPGTSISRCSHENITCFFDSQCGANGLIYGLFCGTNNNILQNYLTFTCNKPGEVDSYCSNSTSTQEIRICSERQKCSGGDCLDVVCFNNSECNNDNNSLTEDICNSPGQANSTCSHLPIACFSETDCGTDGIVHPLFCESDRVMYHFLNFTCNNAGTGNSYCSNLTTVSLNNTCSPTQLCSEGACYNVPCFNDLGCNDLELYTQDKCINNGTLQSNCTHTPIVCFNDSDSHCDDSNASTEDNCNNPGTINSNCTHTSIRCLNNNQCNDNIYTTEDICNSPGKINSTCSNINITCFNNSQCGGDGFMGDKFCKNNNVNWNYITYTCNNNGTGSSYCMNSLSNLTVQSCNQTQICSNATCSDECFNDAQCNDLNDYTKDECKFAGTLDSNCTHEPMACLSYNDSKCDDGNMFTEDSCINPNTTSSYCQNLSIRCFNDSMCGINGLIGNNFCSSDNLSVSGNYNEYKCSNPGKAISSCSNSSSPLTVLPCLSTQLCENAACKDIPCLDDLNCSDNNNHTEDHCLDPKKLNSKCIHLNITCLSDEDANCNDNDINTEDHCINASTTTSYCTHLPIICFNNSGCGGDGYIENKFCDASNRSVNRKYNTTTCYNPGTSNSSCSSLISVLKDDCLSNQVCDNAICKDVICFNNAQCNDSEDHTFDLCNIPGTPGSTCSYLPIECLSDSDPSCNDNNDYTKEICTNPGTILANCTHKNIICFTDLDCGNNGIIGEDYCNGDKTGINGNYNKYVCSNPGTPESSCSNSTSPLLIHPCDFDQLCDNAICKDIICMNNSGCDDSEDHTLDICDKPATLDSTCLHINITCLDDSDENCHDNNISTKDYCLSPGKTNSTCTYKQIDCFTDSQCGTNRFLGDNFCMDNEIKRNYITYTCNNNGTVDSSCTNSISISPIASCASTQLCDNAICKDIPCLNDLNCSDGEDHTEDRCLKPGQLDSSCKYINITCLGNSDCLDQNLSTEDICVDKGYTNSTCSHLPIRCFDNDDCGYDGFNGDKFCNNNSVKRNYLTYTCSNPGKAISSCSSSDSILNIETCSSYNQACENAACKNITCFNNNWCNDINDSTFDVCNDAGNTNSSCFYIDIECLTSNDAKCNDNNPYTLDECINPGNISSKCSNKNITCFNDEDYHCNDNNNHTEDHCINASTITSYCTHLPIRCLNDLECGENKFIGDKSCSGNNVTWEYLTHTCNNNGTAASSCSNSTEIQRLWECHSNQLCLTGKCMNVTCFNDNECADNKTNTLDKCINNGTLSSYCNYTIINNTSCGTNGFIGNNYCDGNNVVRNNITYNPRDCSNSTTPQLIKSCSSNEYCSNGNCILNSNLIVNSPQNIIYNTGIILINVTTKNKSKVDNQIKYRDYYSSKYPISLCSKCIDYGFTTKMTKTFKEGNHSVVFIATNGVSDESSNAIYFFVDSIVPRIYSFTPTNKSFSNGNNFLVKYNEANLMNISLIINNITITKSSCPSGAQECSFSPNLSHYNGQNITYQFILTDIANNIAKSHLTKVSVDQTLPIINNPNSLRTINGKFVNFKVNVTELNLKSVNFIDNSVRSPRWSPLCSGPDQMCLKTVYFTSGDHNVTIQALDKAGNSVVQSTFFTIN